MMRKRMAKYGQAFKDRAVARLLPPESAALEDVAHDVGVGVGTLERFDRRIAPCKAIWRAWVDIARSARASIAGCVG